MQQSNFIFGMLLIAYIVYITAKGELPTYIQLLRGGGAQPAGTSANAGSAASGILSGAAALLNSDTNSALNPTSGIVDNPLGLSNGSGFSSSDLNSIANAFNG